MSTQKPALKNAITQILSCALQPHSDIQRLTEERKKALEMTEGKQFKVCSTIPKTYISRLPFHTSGDNTKQRGGIC